VKSERIVSSLERSEVLPADLKRRIERYVSLWREESWDTWPMVSFPRALTLGNSPPGKDSSIEPHITGYGRSSSLWLWSIVLRLSGC